MILADLSYQLRRAERNGKGNPKLPTAFAGAAVEEVFPIVYVKSSV
jgi:hypothetical protein